MSSSEPPPSRLFHVTFQLHHPSAPPTATLSVVGSSPSVGAWSPRRAVPLTRSPTLPNVFTATLPSVALPLEYKYIVSLTKGDGGDDDDDEEVVWEALPGNRVLSVPPAAFNGSAWLRVDVFNAPESTTTTSVPTSSSSSSGNASVAVVSSSSSSHSASAAAPTSRKKKKPKTARATDTTAALQITAEASPAPQPTPAVAAALPAPSSKAPEPPKTAAAAAAPAEEAAPQRQGILEALFQYRTSEPVRCVQFDASRPWIACGLQTRVQVFNYQTSDVEFSTPPFPSPITAVAFAAATPHMAIGAESGDVWLYDHGARQLLPSAPKDKHSKAVRALLFHPTLPWLISGGDDTTIRVFDFAAGKDLFVVTGHRYAVRSLQLAAHSADVLVSASLDRTVRVWDLGAVTAEPRAAGAAIVCVASISTASVPSAHNDGVAFAALPQPNLVVSASIDGEVIAFQMTGLGAGDKPRELYVDVIDTAALRLPRRADLLAQREAAEPPAGNDAHLAAALGDAAELDGGTGLYRGAGVLRVAPDLHATLFVNDSVAYLSTLAVVPDGTELAAVLEPICFAVLGGTGGVLSPVDVEASGAKGEAQAAPAQFELVTLARAHPSEPVFVVLHADNLMRVMRVTPQFLLLLQVHNSTQLVADKSTWLATITRGVAAQTIANAFAAHADGVGVTVTMDAQNKSKFVARLRAAPGRALDVQIGINDDGKRVLQAHWNDDRDGVLWRDLLRSFSLLYLARNKLLVDKSRRFLNTEAAEISAASAASTTICSIQ